MEFLPAARRVKEEPVSPQRNFPTPPNSASKSRGNGNDTRIDDVTVKTEAIRMDDRESDENIGTPSNTGSRSPKKAGRNLMNEEDSSEVSSDSEYETLNNNIMIKPPCSGCEHCEGVGSVEAAETGSTGGCDRQEVLCSSPEKAGKEKGLRKNGKRDSSSDFEPSKGRLKRYDNSNNSYVTLATAPVRTDQSTVHGISVACSEKSSDSDSQDYDIISVSEKKSHRTKKPQRKNNSCWEDTNRRRRKARIRTTSPPTPKKTRRVTRSTATENKLSSDSDSTSESCSSESSDSDSEVEDNIDDFIVQDDDGLSESSSSRDEATSSEEDKSPEVVKTRRKVRNLTRTRIPRKQRNRRSSPEEDEIKTLRSRKIVKADSKTKRPARRDREESEDLTSDAEGEEKSSESCSPPKRRSRRTRNRNVMERENHRVTRNRIKQSQTSSSSEDEIRKNSDTSSNRLRGQSENKGRNSSSDDSVSELENSSSSPTKDGIRLKSSFKSDLNKSVTRSGKSLRRSPTKQVTFDHTSVLSQNRRRISRDSGRSSSSDDLFQPVTIPASKIYVESKAVNSDSSKSESSEDSGSERVMEVSPPKLKRKKKILPNKTRSPPPAKKRRKESPTRSTSSSESSDKAKSQSSSSDSDDTKTYHSRLRSRLRNSEPFPDSRSRYRESPSLNDMSEAVERNLKSYVDTTGYGIRRRKRRLSGNRYVQDDAEKGDGSDDSSNSFVDNTAEPGGLLESSADSSGEEEPKDNLDLNSDNYETGSSEDDIDEEKEDDSGTEKSQSDSDDARVNDQNQRPPATDSVSNTCALCSNLPRNKQIVGRDAYFTSEKWCKCGCCKVVGPKMRDYDRLCCKEYEGIRKFISDDDGNARKCITKHPRFESDFMDYIGFLKAVKTKKRQIKYFGPAWAASEIVNFKKATEANKICMCGETFIRWIFGNLGEKNRLPVPACVMARIRKKYAPNAGPSYFSPYKPPTINCAAGVHCKKAKVAYS